MDDIDKIEELDLRRFAKGNDTDDRRSVIVELQAPPVRLRAGASSKSPRSYDRQILPAETEAQAHESDAMDRLEAELHSLGLVRDVKRLDVAQAFVANASPEQLRSIASLPLVGAIRHNKTRRVSAT
jgi:hypothetical protein